MRYKIIIELLLVSGFALAWLSLVRPVSLGGVTDYIIVSGKSMEPTMYSGDLAVTRAESDYELGDIVAFQTNGSTIIHRLVGERADEVFITRGDGNSYDDPWTINRHDIIGRSILYVPAGGKIIINILNSFRQPIFIALYFTYILTIFLVSGNVFAKSQRTRAGILHKRRKYFHVRGRSI